MSHKGHRTRRTKHYKSKAGYERSNAYRFIHLGKKGGHKRGETYPKVSIAGRPHKVRHRK